MSEPVDLLLITWNRRDYVKRTLDNLLNDPADFRLYCWDNGSKDGAADIVASYKDDRIIKRHYCPINIMQAFPFEWFLEQSRSNIIGKVDDDTLVRDTMRDMLDAEGYHTTAVESGESALRVARRADFDLLLTDIKMPEMDGLELVQELQQLSPDIIAILITGYASIATARKAIREGVYDYILKPFDRSELTAAVESALGRKRLADENAKLKWLFGLVQVTQAVAAGSEYYQLLEFIVRTAITETKSTGGSIVLFDEAISGVTIAAATGRWEYAAQIANTVLNTGVASFREEMGRCILFTDIKIGKR